ncbi:MAG: hemolysin family protein [Lachnospiraceae bacterium]
MQNGYSMGGIITFLIVLLIDVTMFAFAAAISEVSVADWQRREEEGKKHAAGICRLLENGSRMNYTIQILAMMMNIVVGAYVLQALSVSVSNITWVQLLLRQAGQIPWAQILSAVVLMMLAAIFGIIIPAKVGQQYPDRVVEKLYPVVRFVLIVLTPIIVAVTVIGNVIIRILGMNPNTDTDNVTEEEILTMVNEGHEQGVIEADEAEMINNIFEYGDKEAQDIMTHRMNMLAIDGNMTLEEAVSFMLHENNSRYPVYDGDINNIIGIIHIKDALKEYGNRAKAEEPIKNIDELLYTATLIPGTRNIDDLFKQMQKEKVHMAIVVDEYGQTAGLVTMEDILEEIVGNILDEHDEDEEQIQMQEDHTYVVDGMTLLEDLEEELSISFGVEDISTLNGFLTLRIGKIPKPEFVGMKVEYEGYSFEILEVEKRIIRSVSITPIEIEKKVITE